MVTPAQGRDGSQNFPSIFRAHPGVHRVRLDCRIRKKKTQCKRLLPGLAFTPRPCPEHLQFSSGLIVLLHVRLRDPEGLSTLPKDTQPTCGISMKGIPALLAEESLALGLPIA